MFVGCLAVMSTDLARAPAGDHGRADAALEWEKGDASVRQWDKILRRVLSGQADQYVRFADLLGLLVRLGFDERIRGDHHTLGKTGVREIIDLQPVKDGKAKPYQVKQVRGILRKYGLMQVP